MNSNKLRADFESWAKSAGISTAGYIPWQAYQAAHNAQQAIIDRLMLEWCPDEMSKEQMAAWESAQRRCGDDL